MNTYKELSNLFHSKFTLNSLKGITPIHFEEFIMSNIDKLNSGNFLDPTFQRDLSIKFHWGHNHEFGKDFILEGKMKNRHIEIISSFVDEYGLPVNLKYKKVLDIGVWTGGTSLLLAAMGAEVYAIEEVIQYAEMVNYLSRSFGYEHVLRCYSSSLYEFLPMFADFFDYIIYSGVIYHVSDPLLSLREIFTALKDNGKLFIETYGIDEEESKCLYEGSKIFSSGNLEDINRGGWNYFIPSPLCLERWCRDAGFQEVRIGTYNKKRINGAAIRTQYRDFCRAGIARKNIR